jgi:hypothetical protein
MADDKALQALRNNAATLAVALNAMQEALHRSLLKSCEAGDASKELKWFSELENDLVHRAKDTVTEGMSMPNEVIIIDQATEYLRFVFSSIRREVIEKTKGK